MYYIINKDAFSMEKWYFYARTVTVFMLGRQCSQYIIVKSDEAGDRVVPVSTPNMSEYERILENA